MPTGHCANCRRYTLELEMNGRCRHCQNGTTYPKSVKPKAPDQAVAPSPNNRTPELLRKRVMAEQELAVRIGGSCSVCRFSVMSDCLRCHRMPPVNIPPGGAAARPGDAGGHWDFPSVMPFSSCGEFVLQPELSKDGEPHFGESADGGDQVRQRINPAGMGNFAGMAAGAVAGEVAETAAYLWYFNQVQDMYIDAAGIGDVGGDMEDSGNFLQDLFGL